jgi:hypothetical protein
MDSTRTWHTSRRSVRARVWQWAAALIALAVFVLASIRWSDVFLNATNGGEILAATIVFALVHVLVGLVAREWAFLALIASPIAAHTTCEPGYLDICDAGVALVFFGELFVGVPLVAAGGWLRKRGRNWGSGHLAKR